MGAVPYRKDRVKKRRSTRAHYVRELTVRTPSWPSLAALTWSHRKFPINSPLLHGMGESGGDKPSTNTVNQVRDQLWAAADLSTQAVDEGIQAASHAVKYGAVRVMEEMERAKVRSQVYSCSPS